jgi:hypothetical protein
MSALLILLCIVGVGFPAWITFMMVRDLFRTPAFLLVISGLFVAGGLFWLAGNAVRLLS